MANGISFVCRHCEKYFHNVEKYEILIPNNLDFRSATYQLLDCDYMCKTCLNQLDIMHEVLK